jgi:hypothetical protein
MITQPAFKPAALIIVRTRALALIIITALEALNIKISHIRSDFLKIFDKLTV